MKIAVVGAGPAGLFFARLMKSIHPKYEIDIFEQNPENATYGFGVTLGGSARDRLLQVDPIMHDRLSANMLMNNDQDIRLNSECINLKYAQSGGAIARLKLLNVMEELCREVGLEIVHDRRIEVPADVDMYDLVVGADGANSVIRGFDEAAYDVTTRVLNNRFAWYGVNKILKPNGLSFKNVDGGVYVAHYYAYASEMSTFVAECDDETWTRHGLSEMSDEARKALIEKIFHEELEGEKLVENNSTWRQFTASTTKNWSCGKNVLIGDALRVAHFSIGSGTRLAMDDALALYEAISTCGDDALAGIALYEKQRKPNRDLFTEATVKSFDWYENIRSAMQTDIAGFTKDFLTRTGRVDDKRLQSYVPEFYRDYVASRKSTSDVRT